MLFRSGELSELVHQIQSGEGDRVDALGRIVVLNSQSVDCSSAYASIHRCATYGQQNYIKSRRFVGILNESYMEKVPNMVNTVVQGILLDFEKNEGLLKGIAVRHAGKMANDETVDKLVPIIVRGASNDDPYVRKTAALAILNLNQTKPSYVDKFKLGPILKNLVEDSNPNVAANAVSALTEINQSRTEPLFIPQSNSVNNLLAAIDQATEWSQVEILDFVSTYKPQDATDARGIIARVSSRLSHVNSAVVLSAIRCCLQMNLFIDDQAKVRDTLTKIVFPLVTLLNNSHPIQYIAVKSILILLQNYKRMLSSEVSIFFCKYDDPLYMKLVKLDVILTLSTTQNVGKVLEELFNYAQQTDTEFVRKSIRAIGKIAVQFEAAADGCVDKIVALIDMKVHYVVQECIVIAVDIFRRYPGKYEGIIANINAALGDEAIDDHRARAAMIWILGEYAEDIGNAGELLDALFIDNFCDETPDVQLSILTAVVKYYLVSEDGDELLRKVITMATNNIDNPDVRDRAFMYYWLVSEAPEDAADVILTNRENPPPLNVELFSSDPELIKQLVPQIGTLSILYNKLPSEFVQTTRFISLDLGNDALGVEPGQEQGETSFDQMSLAVLVDPSKAYGVEIRGMLIRIGDQNSFVLRFTNYSETPLDMQRIAFNKNIFGFAPGEFSLPPTINPQKTLTINIPVIFSEQHLEGAQPSPNIQIAVLVNRDAPIFFEAPANLNLILVPADQGGKLTREQFMSTWQGISDDNEINVLVHGARVDSIDVAKHKMQQNRLFFTAKKGNCAYFSGKTIKGEILIVYIVFEENATCRVGIKMYNKQVSSVILELVKQSIQ